MSAGSPRQVTSTDPCGLIHPDQAKELGLSVPARTDLAGQYTACSWSTRWGSSVTVSLQERAHTVEEFVGTERTKEAVGTLTVSSWAGERHQGAALNWGDGHGSGVVITVSPTQIATVTAYDGGEELGRRIPDVLRGAATAVDRNLPT